MLGKVWLKACIYLLLLASSLSVCTAVGFADAAQPVVAVDEYHQNALRPNIMWNMSTLISELTAGGYAIREIKGPISSTTLAGCSELIITAPSNRYSSDELAAVQSFTGAGGGLMLCANYGVSDGTTTPWAPICQTLANNVGLSLDSTSATDNLHNADGYPYWIPFSGSSIGSHPVMTGVNSLQCFATTTMPAPTGSTMLARTDSDASPSLRPTIITKPYNFGRVILSGSPLYLANPVYEVVINDQTMDMMGLLAADNRRFAYNAVTWLAGASGRPLVAASLTSPSCIVYDTATVTGTVCDATLAQYVLEYASLNSSNWISIGSAQTSSVINGILGSWDVKDVEPGDYTLRVRAINIQGNQYSVCIPVTVKRLVDIARTGDVKTLDIGELVRVTGKEVVGGSDELNGRICVEERDRLSGATILTSQSVPRGSSVTAIGTLKMVDGVLVIDAISIDAQAGSVIPISPLGMSNRSACEASSTMGTSGVLTRAWGSVTGTDAVGFTISDGGSGDGLKIITVYARAQITPPDSGKTVVITGIRTLYNGEPCLIVRNQDDIKQF